MNTHHLALPYLAAAQAQKHVTLNESLRILDSLVHAHVTSRTVGPPAEPQDGDRYIAVPGMGWDAPDNALVARIDGAWQTFEPQPGWLVHVGDESTFVVYRNGWEPFGFSEEELEEVARVGIGTTADDTNRLAVSSPASLFTHEGTDHRMAVNRASDADTASLLFQTGFSGRAEMGLAGEDAFSLKVSDGTEWTTVLRASPAGVLDLPTRPAVRANLTGGWVNTPDRGKTGFSEMSPQRGGFTLGAPIADSPGQRLVVPITGIYLATLQIFTPPVADFRVSLRELRAARDTLFVQLNESTTTSLTQASTSLLDLEAGDELCLSFLNVGRCFHAPHHTQVTLIML